MLNSIFNFNYLYLNYSLILMDKLRNDGYILIENVKYKKNFNDSLHSFYNNNITDYKKLKYFIDNQYCPVLNKIIQNNHKIFYNRFKFNNNNATNSSIFHSDLYNHTNENIINIYSCLYYFDDAYLEIIPRSHRKDFLMKNNFNSSYNYKKKIYIQKGTFVILHSNIHHRILNNINNNRILQIYDVSFNEKDYKYYIPKIIVIKTYNSFLLKNILTFTNYVIKNNNESYILYVHYFLVYYDIQYKLGIFSSDLSPLHKKDKLISYESDRRLNISKCNLDETNINIICNDEIKSCNPGNFYFLCSLINPIISLLLFYYVYKKAKK